MNKKILLYGILGIVFVLASTQTMAATEYNNDFSTTLTRKVQPTASKPVETTTQVSKPKSTQPKIEYSSGLKNHMTKHSQYYCVTQKPLRYYHSRNELFYPIMYNTKDTKEYACKKAAYKVFGNDFERYGEQQIGALEDYQRACMTALNNVRFNCSPVLRKKHERAGASCEIIHTEGPDMPTLLYVTDYSNPENVYTPCLIKLLNDYGLAHRGGFRIIGADPLYGQYKVGSFIPFVLPTNYTGIFSPNKKKKKTK